MRQLIDKYPDGLAGFDGDLTPTKLMKQNSPAEDQTGGNNVNGVAQEVDEAPKGLINSRRSSCC